MPDVEKFSPANRELTWSDLTLPPINLHSLPALKVVVLERKSTGNRVTVTSKLIDNPVYLRRKHE